MKFIDQSFFKRDHALTSAQIQNTEQNIALWSGQSIKTQKQFLDKCISIFTTRPYCTNWCGISVPLSSNEFQWSRWCISSNSQLLKWLWTVSFHQHAFLVKNKFFPENTKRNISLSYSNSWRQQLSCSIKVSSWEPKATKCLIDENFLRYKAFFNSSTLMNYAPQKIRMLTLKKKTRNVCNARRFVTRP